MPVTDLVKRVLKHEDFQKFKRYVIVGLLSFAIEYGLYTLLFAVLNVNYLLSNMLVYSVTFWFNFLLNRCWSFNARNNLKHQLILYGILFIFNFTVTNVMIYVFSDILGIYPLISKVLIMFAVVSWNFIIYKRVIYK